MTTDADALAFPERHKRKPRFSGVPKSQADQVTIIPLPLAEGLKRVCNHLASIAQQKIAFDRWNYFVMRHCQRSWEFQGYQTRLSFFLDLQFYSILLEIYADSNPK